MNKTLAVVSAAIVTGILGLAPNAHASSVNGAAALSGVQGRSIQLSSNPTQAPLLNPYERSTIGASGSFDDQATYRQLDSDTNLVVSPVKDDKELLNSVNAGDTGNNRIQVLYQPVQ